MTSVSRLTCAVAVLFFTLLAGCDRNRLVNQLDSPISKQQEALAIAGAGKLRELFNQGNCQAIFKNGAFAGGVYSQNDWLDDCAQLRKDTGQWKSFALSSAFTCGARDPLSASMV